MRWKLSLLAVTALTGILAGSASAQVGAEGSAEEVQQNQGMCGAGADQTWCNISPGATKENAEIKMMTDTEARSVLNNVTGVTPYEGANAADFAGAAGGNLPEAAGAGYAEQMYAGQATQPSLAATNPSAAIDQMTAGSNAQGFANIPGGGTGATAGGVGSLNASNFSTDPGGANAFGSTYNPAATYNSGNGFGTVPGGATASNLTSGAGSVGTANAFGTGSTDISGMANQGALMNNFSGTGNGTMPANPNIPGYNLEGLSTATGSAGTPGAGFVNADGSAGFGAGATPVANTGTAFQGATATNVQAQAASLPSNAFSNGSAPLAGQVANGALPKGSFGDFQAPTTGSVGQPAAATTGLADSTGASGRVPGGKLSADVQTAAAPPGGNNGGGGGGGGGDDVTKKLKEIMGGGGAGGMGAASALQALQGMMKGGGGGGSSGGGSGSGSGTPGTPVAGNSTAQGCYVLNSTYMCPKGTSGASSTGCVYGLDSVTQMCPMTTGSTSTAATDAKTLYNAGMLDALRGLEVDKTYGDQNSYLSGFIDGLKELNAKKVSSTTPTA